MTAVLGTFPTRVESCHSRIESHQEDPALDEPEAGGGEEEGDAQVGGTGGGEGDGIFFSGSATVAARAEIAVKPKREELAAKAAVAGLTGATGISVGGKGENKAIFIFNYGLQRVVLEGPPIDEPTGPRRRLSIPVHSWAIHEDGTRMMVRSRGAPIFTVKDVRADPRKKGKAGKMEWGRTAHKDFSPGGAATTAAVWLFTCTTAGGFNARKGLRESDTALGAPSHSLPQPFPAFLYEL